MSLTTANYPGGQTNTNAGSNVNTLSAATFIPEIWSDEILASYQKNLVLANLVKKLSMTGKKGDTLHIPKPVRVGPENFSLADLALKWILMHDEVSVVIPGAVNESQVQMNAHASELEEISSITPMINSIYDELIKPDVHNRW